jgi:hypothetical protein
LNLLESVGQISLLDHILPATGGKERRFVHEICEIGASHARS